jgi:hypothetical protein
MSWLAILRQARVHKDVGGNRMPSRVADGRQERPGAAMSGEDNGSIRWYRLDGRRRGTGVLLPAGLTCVLAL